MKISTILFITLMASTANYQLVSAFSFLLPETGWVDSSGDLPPPMGGEEGDPMGGEETEGPTTTTKTFDFTMPNIPPVLKTTLPPVVENTLPPVVETTLPTAVETTLPPLIKYNDTVTEAVNPTGEESLLGGGGSEEDDDPTLSTDDGNLSTFKLDSSDNEAETLGMNTKKDSDNDTNEPGSYSSSGADLKLGNFRFYIGLALVGIIFCLVY
eukprot:TCONS_00028326-protein